MRPYPGKGVPLTISMWDFSWLQCGHPGGAFADLSRRVQEAAERGFNTLRVDVFPQQFLQGVSTFNESRARRIPTWGDVRIPGGYEVDVRKKVVELAELCRRHDVWLGLDTWQVGTMVEERTVSASQEETVCRRIADTWVEALRLMREMGVLERAVWVAPLNEVPLFLGTRLERVQVSDPEQRHEGMTEFRSDLPQLDEIFRNVNHWLGEAIAEEVAKDGIPLSYSALGAENYADRVTDIYSLVDVHFMPDAQLAQRDREALEKAGEGASKFSLHGKLDSYDLALFGAAWERACASNYESMLMLVKRYMQAALARLQLPSGKQLDAVLTENYGPCNHPDHPEVDWTWFMRYSLDATKLTAQFPFVGISINNHAEPIFRFWDELDLLRSTNAFVRVTAAG